MKKNKQILLVSMLFLISCSSGESISNEVSTSKNEDVSSIESVVTSSEISSSTITTSSIESSSEESSSSKANTSEESITSNSISSSSGVISSEISSVVSKYKVTFVKNPNVTTNLIGSKMEFEKGEEVSFSYSPKYGFKVTSLSIKDKNLNDVAYEELSYIKFLMPESDVTVSFVTEARKTLEIVNGAHSTINVVDKMDYYDEGAKINFTLDFENGYELDTLKVLKEENSSFVEVQYTILNDVYSFDFVNANMKIEVIDKEKVVSDDPFANSAVYEGDWDYYDGYYDYLMRFRIIFNGDYTLSWYLTWEDVDSGYEEYYALNYRMGVKKNAKPSDMVGTLRDSQENIAYVYDATSDTISFVSPIKMSTKEYTLILTRNENQEITSIKMSENLSDGFYQTGNKTLTKK